MTPTTSGVVPPVPPSVQVDIKTTASTTATMQPRLSTRSAEAASTMLTRQCLHTAAQKGDLNALCDVLLYALDAINEVNPQTGLTPLQTAIDGGHHNVAEMLIGAGARVHPVDSACPPGKVSLYAASEDGRPELLAASLASSSADLNTPDPLSGLTPLMFAMRGNHLEAAKILIAAGATVTQTSAKGEPPIVLAARKGNAATVALLLDSGAAVDQKDGDSKTALQSAIRLGEIELARLLLQRGADVGCTDDEGRTALFDAVAMRKPGMVGLLLNYQSEIEHSDKYGQTPLCWAASLGYAEQAATLLENGASVEHQSRLMGTPLMGAARVGHQDVLELLLHGSRQNIDEKDSDGNTALHLAAMRGHDAAVNALLKAGASISPKNGRGNTPLEVAARAGHVEATRVLLDSEQNLERATLNGQFALNQAVRKDQLGVVELLLQRGVDADDVVMERAKTPMMSELLRRAPMLMQSTQPDDAPQIDGAALFTTLVDTAARRKHTVSWGRRLELQDICDGVIATVQAAASDLRAVWASLAGSSRKITPAQQKNWCAGILADLDNAISINPPYTGKGLTSATENRFNHLATQQASALAQAGLDAEQPLREGMDDLLWNCMQAVSEDKLDPLDLYKLLTDQLGIYHTVASLVVSAFADVWSRRHSLGELTLEQAFAREVSERRQKLKMVQAINSNSAAVRNQPTVQMLTYRQFDLLTAWCDKALRN